MLFSRVSMTLFFAATLVAGIAAQTVLKVESGACTLSFSWSPTLGANFAGVNTPGFSGSGPHTAIVNPAAALSPWRVRVLGTNNDRLEFDVFGARTFNVTTGQSIHSVDEALSVLGTITTPQPTMTQVPMTSVPTFSSPQSAPPHDTMDFEWALTFSGQIISSAWVHVQATTTLNSEWISLWIEVSILPSPTKSAVIESVEFPRFAFAPPAAMSNNDLDKRNKLYVPIEEGCLISNFTDPYFYFNQPENFMPNNGALSHQWWGIYHTTQSPSSIPTTFDHDVSDSELTFFGPLDLSGYAKSLRVG